MTESRRKPSLLIVTRTARVAGAERLIIQMLPGLMGRFDVKVCVLSGAPSGGDDWPEPLADAREALGGRYDLIHTHLFVPGLLVRIRRIWDGSFRWVHTVHYDSYPSLRMGALRRWIDRRFIFPAVDELACVSVSVLEGLEHPPNACLIENAIPMEVRWSEGATTATEAGGEARASGAVLGTVAMFRREKGLDDLIEAVAELTTRRPQVRLKIAGDGPLRPDLERMIDALDLGDTVELCGYVTDLDAFYRSLDVYVQASRHEPFGLAALECFTYGLPFIASSVGNMPRMLGDGSYGELVPREGDVPAGLAAAMDRVLDHKDAFAAKSRAGYEYWSERLSPQGMLDAYCRVYERQLLPGICMISPLVTHATGGVQRQLLLQSRELARRGYRVYLLQRRDRRLPEDEALAREWSHVTFLETPNLMEGWAGPLATRARGAAFVFFGVLRILRHRRNLALLHGHQLYSPAIVGALGKLLTGRPLVMKVTASGELGEMGELSRLPFGRLRRWAFRQIDRLITLTAVMSREMIDFGFADSVLVELPNSVAIPDETARPLGDSGPVGLLYCGRLSTEKSLDTLLEGAARVAKAGRALRVDLVGAGFPGRDAEPDLRRLADTLDVDIRFHGDQTDMAPFYREADVFVLPSVSEGMSNALLEAMSYGLLILASDIPENRSVIEHGKDGVLFRQGDAEDLARKLESLLENADGSAQRLARAARETAQRRFSVGAIVDRLEALYGELVD